MTQKYEYTYITGSHRESGLDFKTVTIESINEQASKGWELVQIIYGDAVAVMKREVKP